MREIIHRTGIAPTVGKVIAVAALLLTATLTSADAQTPAPARKSTSAPAAPAPAAPPIPEGPVGVWLDHTGRGAVEIVPCAMELCGRIVWMKEPADKTGKPLVDSQNTDKARRAAPICGLQIIGGLKQQRDGSWDNGWIYDPEQGESFDLEVRLLQDQSLQVKGYKVVKFLNETFKWQRLADTPGPRCAT
jgi:uncharacterized protein (DUF2147 family)